jgi:hypothetical protein
MTGVMLDFTGARPMFGTTAVAGFQAIVQNAMVNIATRMGTDPLYPTRGTNLQTDAAAGRLIDLNSAQHSSNFAALETMTFSRATEGGDPDGLSQVLLPPAQFSGASLRLEAQFQSISGKTVGITIIA